MNGSSIQNFDACDHKDAIYFESYAEFKTWLTKNHGANCKEFISEPIQFTGETDAGSFDLHWKACDWFTSGNVCFRKR